MKRVNTAGANYLRSINHVAHTRVWTDQRRALWKLAHGWLDEGIQLDLVILRIENITMKNGDRI